MDTLSLAFVGHLVGDYLFQTDWMAENKKKSSLVCAIHSTLWALSILFFTGWGLIPFIILFAFHFIQDRTTIIRNWMRFIGQEHFATGPYTPWSVVIVDNTFHIVQIWMVWKMVGLGWIS